MEKVDLSNQHGVAIGDYYRCKKNNGKACELCLKVAANYRRAQVRRDPEKYKEQDRDYYKRYPEKMTEVNRKKERKRRARLRQVLREIYSTQEVLDKWGTNCHICDESIDLTATRHTGEPGWERGLHLEHVIALIDGGHDTLENVKPAHAKCNLDKEAERKSLLISSNNCHYLYEYSGR